MNNDLSYTPFQKMRYGPNKSALAKNDFLQTMSHTDYLLKFFSTGVEVSAKSPFAIRSVEEGLIKRLPTHLRNVVRSICDRKGEVQCTPVPIVSG